MTRLNYILFHNQFSSGLSTLLLTVSANYHGTPQARIYKSGDSVPAFSNMAISGSSYVFPQPQINTFVQGTYFIDYKDDKGERTLGKFIVTYPNPCFSGDNPGVLQIIVNDSKVRVTTNRNLHISIDGGFTFKAPVSGAVEWTNTEMENLGIDINNVIPELHFKRITVDGVDVTITNNTNQFNPADVSGVWIDGTVVNLESGTFPVLAGQQASGTSLKTGTVNIDVNITFAIFTESNLILFVNGGFIECKDISANGTETFAGVNLTDGDVVHIFLSLGSCT